ncbi:IclR family transcriptional regulator [uncultured Jatrophihabitans sp.]|uniref:IclR family transcriptional regulator n=1 Tax=uncultured Jatrophihabitans sp. TaxID=1610747 RepID=UPI0035C96916
MATVPAADQALRILDYLGRQAGPVGAAALARDLALPRSTAYHLLGTLAERNYVTRLPDEQRWALGLAAYELGTGYTRQAPLARVARVPLADLVDRTGHTAHLAVLHGNEVVYVLEERAPGRPPLITDVGVRLPAHLTASGRAMLAQLPGAQICALYPDASAFVDRTGDGPRSVSALRVLLAETRRRGHAQESGEVSPGFSSIAVPVHDHSGRPTAAVAATFPIDAVTDDERGRIAGAVRHAAATVARRVYGRPAR